MNTPIAGQTLEPNFDSPFEVGYEPRTRMFCACLQVLEWEDLDRGYHLACGRDVKLVLGEPPAVG